MGYHHGDLRSALIAASFELLAESGLQRFSVAAAARRLGVSSAAPYRHFPDRAHLLGAVSAVAARELNAAITGDLADAAGTYVRYVVRTGAGIPVIYAAELRDLPDEERREHTRALMATLMELALDTGVETRQQAVALMESVLAVAHGYTSLLAEGFYVHGDGTVDSLADRATTAAAALITAGREPRGSAR
ncbi:MULTISPECIES: TetR/AcrR family transcriptional regulator [Actinoplanes]|uniref:TetR/AcrR family transcriptional regulator n=1 Tax=Actinoplanes TaxID=1865 RepID=UPI0005F2F3B2|nr:MULTISPECIES: TetR/AcrR family transcriptional regulator [Actinoplanes]GLY05318.1 TetR family transcriptional regulator [Actinoplanes sp. NBRC 101535]